MRPTDRKLQSSNVAGLEEASMRCLIVGAGPLVNRLPEILFRDGLEIHVVDGPFSILSKSRFVTEFHAIRNPIFSEVNDSVDPGLIEFFESTNFDFYIYSSDDLVRCVKNSSLENSTKQLVLPIRNPDYFDLGGSKSALSLALHNLRIRTPDFQVVHDFTDLRKAISEFAGDLILKADIGGGGKRVLALNGEQGRSFGQVDETWFPILIQEFVHGDDVSVEAHFMNGELIGWTYTEVLSSETRFGPSGVRRYINPPSHDFLDGLELLGQIANLNSFANITFIRSARDGLHYLVEVDLRPNAWHQFGPALGNDWGASLIGKSLPKRIGQIQLPEEGKVVALYPRAAVQALRKPNIFLAIDSVLKWSGKWDLRNHLDHAVTRYEHLQLIRAIAHGLWKLIPTRLARRLHMFGFTKSLMRLVRTGVSTSRDPANH
jgi:hypothetical protein